MSTTPGSYLIVSADENSRVMNLSSNLQKLGHPKLNDAAHPDIITLQSEGEKNIGIDKIRQFQHDLTIKPASGKNKIGIIMSAQLLTEEAQNALLKILEEPPENTYLFLLCSDEALLLPTIISRCAVIWASQTVSSLSAEEKQVTSSNLETLTENKASSKLGLASLIGSDRNDALTWLDKLLLFIHNRIATENFDVSLTPRKIKSIFEAKKRLKSNSNVRLTMENLFLNW